jgi:hypothetical protein
VVQKWGDEILYGSAPPDRWRGGPQFSLISSIPVPIRSRSVKWFPIRGTPDPTGSGLEARGSPRGLSISGGPDQTRPQSMGTQVSEWFPTSGAPDLNDFQSVGPQTGLVFNQRHMGLQSFPIVSLDRAMTSDENAANPWQCSSPDL